MRTQIDLESEQHALAKRKAADLGISMAEYIRQHVAQDLDHPGPDSDISAIFGLGDSGGSDIAIDRMVATAEAITARNNERLRRHLRVVCGRRSRRCPPQPSRRTAQRVLWRPRD